MRALNLAGRRFGRLTTIERAGSRRGLAEWRFRCDCGAEVVKAGVLVNDGTIASCGCLARESAVINGRAAATHGYSKRNGGRPDPTYKSWRGMHARCFSPTHHNFAHYGARGITVCARWVGERGFENFLADMGERPAGTTIDRIDNDGPYSPDNCRWATTAEQNRNRSDTLRITIGGVTLAAAEWCRRNGITPCTAYQRIRGGWNETDAVTVPARPKRRASR